MSDPRPDFDELMRRLNDGDLTVIEDLVRNYYDEIRTVVRHRLRRYPRLRQVNDSLDFSQDAAASFVRQLCEGAEHLNPNRS